MIVLLTAACGGDGEGAGDAPSQDAAATTAPEPTEAPTTEAASAGPVDVGSTNTDFTTKDLSSEARPAPFVIKANDDDGLTFHPTYVKLQPGARATVVVRNVGFIDHNFTIEALDIDVDVVSGKQKEVKVTMPDDGALRFFCDLHSGMSGAFYSEEGQEVQS